jgi:hypothetical protein
MEPTAERFAVYFAPAADNPLWKFGCCVLGRDATSGADVPLPAALLRAHPEWRRSVTPASRYGFHATLVAPFQLAAGITEEQFKSDLAAACASQHPVGLGKLEIAKLGSFAVLMPTAAPENLGALASTLVRAADHLRAPLTPTDRARRSPDRLTPRQRAYLDRWGYPYVFEEFRFHMTLSGPLSGADLDSATVTLADLYRPHDAPVTIRDVCIFKQLSRQAPFLLIHRQTLAG